MPDDLSRFAWVKPLVTAALLAMLWTWEAWRPYFAQFTGRRARLRHDARNLSFGIVNALLLAVLFGAATVDVSHWAAERAFGLLRLRVWPAAVEWLLALVLLDGWLYLWHRANHRLPLLWRFHRMHHSDPHMDASTAVRFHLGEHVVSAALRLAVIPLLGVSLQHVLVYDVLVIANTLLHHANISWGRCDRLLRLLLVTPDFHKVHHSRERRETDSNYATILSIWDRLCGSYRMRDDLRTIEFGLAEFDRPQQQSLRGMWRTPLVDSPSHAAELENLVRREIDSAGDIGRADE